MKHDLSYYVNKLHEGEFFEALQLSNALERHFAKKNDLLPADLHLPLIIYALCQENNNEKDALLLSCLDYISSHTIHDASKIKATFLKTALQFVIKMTPSQRNTIKTIPLFQLINRIKEDNSPFNHIMHDINELILDKNHEEIPPLPKSHPFYNKAIDAVAKGDVLEKKVERELLAQINALKKLNSLTKEYKKHLEDCAKNLNIPLNEVHNTKQNKQLHAKKLKQKYDAIVELETLLNNAEQYPSPDERLFQFHRVLSEKNKLISQHRDSKWLRFAITSSIIITGILPGIVFLGIYGVATKKSPLFWQSKGQQFNESCDALNPIPIKKI
jgi:Lpg0393 VPS9-like domain